MRDEQYLRRFKVSFPDPWGIIKQGVVTLDKEKGYVRDGDWQDMTDARTCIEAALPKIWKVMEPVLKEHSVKMDVAIKATLFNSMKGLFTFVFPNAKTETHKALEVVHESTLAAFKEAFTKSASVGIGAIENNEVRPSDTRLVAITDVWLNTRKYTPMKAGRHIPTPQWISNKKACVNPTNTGVDCGAACLLMHIYYADVASGAIRRPKGGKYKGKSVQDYQTYKELIAAECISHPWNTAGIPGPRSLDDWERIEKLNANLFVDVLAPTSRGGELRILRCSTDMRRLEEGATEITVILLGDRNIDPEDDNNHYIFVKPGCLGRMVKNKPSQQSSYLCNLCHRVFDSRTCLDNHMQRHIDNQEFGVEVLPQGEDTELRMGKRPFKKGQSYNHSLQHDWWIGVSVLDLSKMLMVRFWYKALMVMYGPERLRLLYTDTDSLVMEITTEDVNHDFKEARLLTQADGSVRLATPADPEYERLPSVATEWLDCSKYPAPPKPAKPGSTDPPPPPHPLYPDGHPLYDPWNAMVPGKFKDESEGREIVEVIALRPKVYSYTEQDTYTKGTRAGREWLTPTTHAKGTDKGNRQSADPDAQGGGCG